VIDSTTINRTPAALAAILGLLLACGEDSEPSGCDAAITTSVNSVTEHPVETTDLSATAVNCDGDPIAAITYSTGDGNVATVSLDGVITGVAYGTTTVTVTADTLSKAIPVSIIGRPFGTSVDTVQTGPAPYGIASAPSGVFYVTHIGGNTVAKGTFPTTIFSNATVGSTPAHVAMAPNGGKAYVTNQFGGSVSVVDVASNTTTNTIITNGEPYNLIVAPSGGTVYASVKSGMVYLINTATEAIVDSFSAIMEPNGFAFSPDGTRLYVSSRGAGMVVVYDTVTNTVLDTLDTGGLPQRMAVSADGTELYIANENLGLDIWNLGTASRIISLPMEGYGLALSPDNSQLYVSSPQGGVVVVFNRASRAVVDSIATGGGPRNITFSRYGVAALIANEAGWVTIVQ
jgi:YVTN family beta-propeller protein